MYHNRNAPHTRGAISFILLYHEQWFPFDRLNFNLSLSHRVHHYIAVETPLFFHATCFCESLFARSIIGLPWYKHGIHTLLGIGPIITIGFDTMPTNFIRIEAHCFTTLFLYTRFVVIHRIITDPAILMADEFISCYFLTPCPLVLPFQNKIINISLSRLRLF